MAAQSQPSPPVSAGEAPVNAPEHEQEAVELFEIGERAYKAGEYAKAVRYMKEALRLNFNPTLLYNLARAHQKAGQLADAIKTYQRYLEAEPTAADRERVQARVKMLEAELFEREALRAEREQPSAPSPASEGKQPTTAEAIDPVPWMVAGASAAAMAVGVTLSALAVEKHRDAKDEPVQATAYQWQNEAEELALAANVTFVVGGALLAAGLVWGIIDASGSGEAPAEAGLTPHIGLGSIAVTGIFE